MRAFSTAFLQEFHTGYRAYSVSALVSIPFEYNSNYFDFDTDKITTELGITMLAQIKYIILFLLISISICMPPSLTTYFRKQPTAYLKFHANW
jgi:hypothetical protein